jgi:gliding motility-associated-like protein
MCNNGFIAFPNNSPILGNYVPLPFPQGGFNMIAAFWADVDEGGATGPPSIGEICWYKITPHYLLMQWDTVGFFAQHMNLQNSFQLIISDGTDPIIPNGNNVSFVYKDMQWAEGDITAPPGAGFFGTNPAVVGLNNANGVNSVQLGLFDQPGNGYYGSNPSNVGADGVSWLNNKTFIMNACTGQALPTISSTSGPSGVLNTCDTFKLCLNDTLNLPFTIWTPLSGATVQGQLQTPVPSGVFVTYNAGLGQEDSMEIQIIANWMGPGIHRIYLYGWDNQTPSDTNYTSFLVDILAGPAHVTVTAAPDTMCVGGAVSTLTASGANSYVWDSAGVILGNLPFLTVNPSSTTTYNLQANTGCGIKDTSIQVVVVQPPVVSITPTNPSVCQGDSIQLTASGGGAYFWSGGFGSDTPRCSTCQTTWVTPSGGFFGGGTFYTVSVINNYGCSASAGVFVQAHPLPTVTASTSQDTICQGSSVNLNAVGAGGGFGGVTYTYTWAPPMGLSCTNCQSPSATPTVSTMYTVTVTDNYGCSNTDSVFVYVIQNPVLVITGHSLCLGDSEVLQATVNQPTYTWQPGNVSNVPSLPVKPNVTTTYTLTSTTMCGTFDTTFTVYVNPKPSPAFTTTSADTGCTPLCVQFNDGSTITSGHITRWKWEFGNGDTLNSPVNNPLYCYNGAGTFNVTVIPISDSGCMDSMTRNNLITAYAHPHSAFTASPQPTTILAPNITFTNQSTDAYGNDMIWQWNFAERGDTVIDTVSFLQNPTHYYEDTGTFHVELVSENKHGCTDTLYQDVVIEPTFVLYAPSAFTPNGDGKNDVFLPEGEFNTFEMWIYDRWGVELFHTTDPTQGWDGKIGSTIGQEDTYIYLVKVKDYRNRQHTVTGEVTLIR